MRYRDYDRHEREASGGGFMAGLIIGGLLGAGLFMYLNSDKGKDKVKDLKAKAKIYRDQIERKLEELKESKFYPAIENIKSELKERIDNIDVDQGKSKAPKRRKYNQ